MKHATKFILVPENEYRQTNTSNTTVALPNQRDSLIEEYNRHLENLGKQNRSVTSSSSTITDDSRYTYNLRKKLDQLSNNRTIRDNSQDELTKALKGLTAIIEKKDIAGDNARKGEEEEDDDDDENIFQPRGVKTKTNPVSDGRSYNLTGNASTSESSIETNRLRLETEKTPSTSSSRKNLLSVRSRIPRLSRKRSKTLKTIEEIARRDRTPTPTKSPSPRYRTRRIARQGKIPIVSIQRWRKL